MKRNSKMDVFVKSLLSDRVRVAPGDISNNIHETVGAMVKRRVEGHCTRHGYVKPGSVEIIKIAPGTLRMVSLNGDVIYTTYYKALVCNPQIGSIVQARVTSTNKFGVLAEVYTDVEEGRVPVLEIIIAKQGAIQSDVDLNSVQVNKTYSVEIMGKKYMLNDKKISAIGKIVQSEHPLVQNDEPDVEDDPEDVPNEDDDSDDANNSETEPEEQEGAGEVSEQEKEDSYDGESEGSDFAGFVEDEEFVEEEDEIDVDDPDADVADEVDDDASVYSTEGI